MDISNITSQITALRAETQEHSISPERVGKLLQQLANLIKSAAENGSAHDGLEGSSGNALSDILASVAPTASAMAITLTCIGTDGEESPKSVSLPLASAEAAGIISAADFAALRNLISGGGGSGSGMTETERSILNVLASRFVRLGGEGNVWRSSQSAEEEAKKLIYCANPDIWFIYYYVQGSKYGLIEQHVCDDTCIQILHWDSAVSQRTITFTDAERTAISEVGGWTPLKVMTAAEAALLSAMREKYNMGIHYLGNVGNSSAPGETAAAALDIVADSSIKWVVYTYSNNVAMIHQTHNPTATVQNMYFAGNRHSRRTISFTDTSRSVIASVGSWATIGTDIGVVRNGTTATIKMVHPLMECNQGILQLAIGPANENYAGLMTKENLRLLNALAQQQEDITETIQGMSTQIGTLNETVLSLQGQIDNIRENLIAQPQLTVSPNPTEITIPVAQTSSSGGRIEESVNQNVTLSAYNENEQQVDVRDCTITWEFENPDDADVFIVEHETEKTYITIMTNAGDSWYSNTGVARLIVRLRHNSTNTSGETEVLLKRVYTT